MDFLTNLGLYDLIGYFVPGFVVVWTVLVVIGHLPSQKERKAFYTTIVIINAYVAGHLIQAVGKVVDSQVYRRMMPEARTEYFDDVENVYRTFFTHSPIVP